MEKKIILEELMRIQELMGVSVNLNRLLTEATIYPKPKGTAFNFNMSPALRSQLTQEMVDWGNNVIGLTKRGNELVLTQLPLCTPTHEIIIDTTKNSRSGLTGFIELGYDPVTKEIFLGDYAVAVQPIENKVELKVIVDQTSVELFTSDGSHWITMAVFTDPGVSRELHAFG